MPSGQYDRSKARRRGRPPGSRNRPKIEQIQVQPEPEVSDTETQLGMLAEVHSLRTRVSDRLEVLDGIIREAQEEQMTLQNILSALKDL